MSGSRKYEIGQQTLRFKVGEMSSKFRQQPLLLNQFKKPSPQQATAFFPGFISVRREVSGAPMNGSLVRRNGRVSFISNLNQSLSREGD